MSQDERSEGPAGYLGTRDYYLATWAGIFRDFLGWTPEQSLAWAEETYGSDFGNEHDLLYHASPQYWIVLSLIPEPARSTLLGRDTGRLRTDLEEAFRDDRYPNFGFPAEMDWTPYRERVAAVVRRHLETAGEC